MSLDRLRKLVGGRTRTVHECRHCGTTLDESAGECPACGSAEIATYEL